jgi:hypothetical protein
LTSLRISIGCLNVHRRTDRSADRGAANLAPRRGLRARAGSGAHPSVPDARSRARPRPEHPGRRGVELGKGLGTHQTTDYALAADETGPVRRERPGPLPFPDPFLPFPRRLFPARVSVAPGFLPARLVSVSRGCSRPRSSSASGPVRHLPGSEIIRTKRPARVRPGHHRAVAFRRRSDLMRSAGGAGDAHREDPRRRRK